MRAGSFFLWFILMPWKSIEQFLQNFFRTGWPDFFIKNFLNRPVF